MKLGVRGQILAASGAVLALLLAIGGLAIASLGSVNDAGRNLYAGDTTMIVDLNAINTALVDRARAVVYGAIPGLDEATQAKIDTAIGADTTLVAEKLAAVRANPHLTAEQAAALDEYAAAAAEYQPMFDAIRADSLAGNAARAAAEIAPAVPVRAKMMAPINKLVADAVTAAEAQAASIGSTFELSRNLILAGMLVALLRGPRLQHPDLPADHDRCPGRPAPPGRHEGLGRLVLRGAWSGWPRTT